MTNGDPDAQRKILHRLRRARGQLDAVISAVEQDKPCRDVVTQLAAVSSALDRAGFAIVSTAMKECLSEPDAEAGTADAGAAGAAGDRGISVEELEKLFMMLA
ncbi:MAG: transcriptional regulator [Microbacterium sp. SCN 70-27]|uniref:metal-sensitive transcriptional regulator n=1 Tax=unclassified Microbacterium TaxID=2609290 RepID=UPI00086CC258|nr:MULTISPECIES: metal-sensitive transcriptional regulator [unclassified Microbacterium]MBN9225208.1 metal-sensitive transcriptional regulator [Microbacterium sp.]ODT27657.1 MAG: transcriptional regulator [Microbacterium sp. SCN 70-27]